jgi:5-oxoprolinase (ATP-hydrolysing)
VRLERFEIRRGSGGDGRWHGGDGAIRRIRFLEPMTAVIVASRRNVVAPFGLQGGDDGAVGRQWVERANGQHEILTGTDSAELLADDVFVIETPGGGGYGTAA